MVASNLVDEQPPLPRSAQWEAEAAEAEAEAGCSLMTKTKHPPHSEAAAERVSPTDRAAPRGVAASSMHQAAVVWSSEAFSER